MDIFIAILYAVFVFCIVLSIRNNLIYSIRGKRLAYIFHDNRPRGEWENLLVEFKKVSYNKQLFQLKKWKYSDFYTDGEE